MAKNGALPPPPRGDMIEFGTVGIKTDMPPLANASVIESGFGFISA